MPAVSLDFPVFDADSHLYEAVDAFTKYLPARYKGAIRYVSVDGRVKIAIKGHISEYIPNPTFEVVAKPGAHMDFFRGNNPEGKTMRELTGEPMRSIPAYKEPQPRVELLDELGIAATLLFPTLASVLEARMMDDPELTLETVHAFNQWLYDVWTFNYQDRIFPTPVVNLAVCERGIGELEWVLERGAKTILVRPAPVAGAPSSRSPFLREFDPFWARVQEAGVPVCLHGSDSGYARYADEWEGNQQEYLPFVASAFRWLHLGRRPITDAIYSAVGHGMLSRFKGVRLATVESGGDWVRRVVEDFKSNYGKMPQEYAEDPVEVFQRQVWVNPFWEDPLDEIADNLGTDHILFGSDYPHPEGLEDPVGWATYCAESGFSHDEVRKLMGANLSDLMGVTLTPTGAHERVPAA